MKKVTIHSNFHNTTATLLAPDGFTTAAEVMAWLELSKHWDAQSPTGSGAMTRKYNRVWRELCPYGAECKCGVKEEKI